MADNKTTTQQMADASADSLLDIERTFKERVPGRRNSGSVCAPIIPIRPAGTKFAR